MGYIRDEQLGWDKAKLGIYDEYQNYNKGDINERGATIKGKTAKSGRQ